jgi:phosphoesterase RecJ-like protein
MGRRVLIIGHENPDGDSLGSSVALARALCQLGKDVTLGYRGRLYNHLLFLLDQLTSSLVEVEPSDLPKFDLMVLVDCAHPNRVWPGFSDFQLLPPWIVIDHHPMDPPKSGPMAIYRDPKASSSGELMFSVIQSLGAVFDQLMAEALLAALMSDTGFFSQANATPESLRQASVLLAAGARSDYVVGRLKRDWTQARVKLLRLALATMELNLSGLLSSMLISQEMMDEAEASLDDMEGFVEYPRAMAGSEVAALFRVDGHGHTRVSLRSTANYNVGELAASFGGGGHSQAAAYTDPSPDPAKARESFLAQAHQFIKPR